MSGKRDDEGRPKRKRGSDTDRILYELDIVQDIVKAIAVKLSKLHPDPQPVSGGHMMLHVTAVDYPQEKPMPAVDVTPALDLASSAVRGKISVVNPRKPDGSRLTSVTWSVGEESEPGAIVLENHPDETVKDEAGAEVLDPADNLPLLIFSTWANTPLEPVAPARASGKVKASGASMADCTKVVSYGDQPVGHFTMVGVEALEA